MLKSYYQILLLLLLLLGSKISSRAQNCNLVSNPDFYAGLEGWDVLKVANGAVPELQINLQKELIVKTIIPGKKSGDARAVCKHIYLEEGQQYVVDFDAYAKQAREVEIAFANFENSHELYFKKVILLDTLKQHYTFSFTMTANTNSQACFQIFLSDNIEKMYFDDFYIANQKCMSGEQKRVSEDPLLQNLVEDGGSTHKAFLKNGFPKVSVNGFARFFTLYRNLSQQYIGAPLAPKTFIVNGVYPSDPLESNLASGYREPFLNLEFSTRPSNNSLIKFDLLLDNQLTGQLVDTSRRVQVYRFANLEGVTKTKSGIFNFKLGGVHFENLSQFTLWNYEFRDDMFERYPWEWAEYSYDKYNDHYTSKSISRDARFGSQSFQGAVLEGTGLPYGFTGKIMFGKANGTNNGFDSFLSNNFKNIIAGRITKQLSTHVLGLVYYNQRGFISDIPSSNDKSNIEDEKVITTTGTLNFEKFNLMYEGGAASFVNPDIQDGNWSPVFMARANISYVRHLPIMVHAFHIGENFLNVNSAVMNNSQYGSQFGLEEQYNSVSFRSGLGEFGQMGSNRQGLNLSASKDIQKLKFALGLGISRELTNDQDGITIQHHLAAVNQSRFRYYRSLVGPYSRVKNIWRHSYETFTVDRAAYGDYSKGYSTLDVSLKYKTNFFYKELIVSNFSTYNSIQDGVSVVPEFTDKAFIRTFYNEINTFLKITKATTIVGQIAYEITKANQYTDKAENGLNADKFGSTYGIGLDIDFGRTAGVYIRQKWYHQKDKNFILDEFKGFESSVELKIWF